MRISDWSSDVCSSDLLARLPPDTLLVLAIHIPLFDPDPQRETFRHADRERLFTLLARFEHRLVLSAHTHSQMHWLHDTADGWVGTAPLHERSEEHTSELQSLMRISYAVFCLKK